ncbi:Protein of unknown function [Caldanaerovirga acetigignens]|uniref:Lipoprotein YerB n=1 Tax=Caldanaerovirga acetigignens TaxID=447595 RepID=A0A1M7FQI5_9FIRM|nr:DUF3048 domain-containing protein [Caldanaerovirga acetigignens]SHM05949.1 Protein of unknown function [Caldanaerovirga acetigignens]
MNRKIIALILFFFILLLPGCIRTTVEEEKDKRKEEQITRPVVTEPILKNPLTGLPMVMGEEYIRPFAVMVENEKNARPQSGLDKADVVYEILTEGGITRFLAVYFGSNAEEIGPVRSARPYFIDFAMEYEAIYVHYGGSPQAYSDLKKYDKIDNIDGIYDNVTFWRDKTRRPPHNAYTSSHNIMKTAQKRGYLRTVKLNGWDFIGEENSTPGSLKEFELDYSRNYKVKYVYDEKKQAYIRYINDKPHVDRKTNEPIAVRNVIIQFMDTRVFDSEGRLAIKTMGSGKGYYISDGNCTYINWEKNSRFAKTKYTTENGVELRLNPGNTWIQIMPIQAKTKLDLN